MREYDEGYYDLHGSRQQSDRDPTVLLSTERSGSNLLRSILNTHSEIVAPHPLETGYPWRNLVPPCELSRTGRRKLIRDVLINKEYSHHPIVDTISIDAVHERVEAADEKSFLTVQEALYATYAETVGATRWVTKDPSVWGYFRELRDYYDDPPVVYLVRDPRDVALSFKRSNVGRCHPYFSALRWQEEQDDGREWLESAFGDRIHVVRYRDLLRHPEQEIEAVCNHLGMEYEPEMLYFYESENAQEAAKSAQAFENLSVPIKSDNYDKFRESMPDEEVRIVEAVAGDEMDYFGFERVYDDGDLASLSLDTDAFEREDRRLCRRTRRRYWRKNPREQLSRFASASFDRYMVLRYGLFA